MGAIALHLVWSQLVGILVITGWATGCSTVMFGVLKMFNVLRVPRETEIQGMDVIKHGEAAYPAQAWKERQYKEEDDIKGGLPPNMQAEDFLEAGGDYLEMVEKVHQKKDKFPLFEQRKSTFHLQERTDWKEVNEEVKAMGFRKLSSSSEENVSPVEDIKKGITGLVNEAFDDSDEVDNKKEAVVNVKESTGDFPLCTGVEQIPVKPVSSETCDSKSNEDERWKECYVAFEENFENKVLINCQNEKTLSEEYEGKIDFEDDLDNKEEYVKKDDLVTIPTVLEKVNPVFGDDSRESTVI